MFSLQAGGEEIRLAPFAYIKDLIGGILHKLEENAVYVHHVNMNNNYL